MKNQLKLILLALLAFGMSSSFAAAYNPFNTPACLTSQIIPWSQLAGKAANTSPNYAIQLTNNCSAALTLVSTSGTQGAFNVYPLTIQTAAAAGTFTGTAVAGAAYYSPTLQAVIPGTTLPWLANAFQLYASGKLVTGSSASATGDAFNLYYDAAAAPNADGSYPTASSLYTSAVNLPAGSWYALDVGPIQPQNVTVNLANTNAPQFTTANITFTQTAQQLGLPANTNVVITLDFSATPLSYLGKYQWYPLQNPVLTIPVGLQNGATSITLNYTVQPAQAPTTPNAFAWRTCTTSSTTAGNVIVAAQGGANFPTLNAFACTSGTAVIKHSGIEGMPLKIDDGSNDGLLNNINNLNSSLTGVIVGFANMLTSGGQTQIELGTTLKSASAIATWQNNMLNFQNTGHVVLISYGGQEATSTQSIWQYAQTQLNPSTAQLNCAVADCAGILTTTLDPQGKIRAAAVANYETLIARYKPNGIDIFPLSTDLVPLANEFTAQVLAQVLADVMVENPNFVLSLSLQPISQAGFDNPSAAPQPNTAFMTALKNHAITPTYINVVYRQFTADPLPKPVGCTNNLVTGTCVVNSLTDYINQYNAIWPAAVIYAGIMPMALQDYSNTIQIWPANLNPSNVKPNQLDGIFSAILTAEAQNRNAGFPGSVLFSYWGTTYDYSGGYVANSYPSNEYQTELATYSNPAYGTPSSIQWNPSALSAIGFAQTSAGISWQLATATDVTLNYYASLYLNGSGSAVIGQAVTNPFTFSPLASGSSYQVVLQAQNQNNPSTPAPVSRVTWLRTSGAPTITWTPNLFAQANPNATSAFATWNCATDSDVTAVLSYNVTIDGGGTVGPVDSNNCTVNFTGLKVGTTYNVAVSVSDNKNGTPPTTSPAKASFATGSTAPAALAKPTTYSWDPKPDGTGILTFNAATGGMPPYTYTMVVSTSGAPPSLPVTALTSCPYSDCSQVQTNMYRVSGMTLGVTYTVSVVATDAAGAQAGMTLFSVSTSN